VKVLASAVRPLEVIVTRLIGAVEEVKGIGGELEVIAVGVDFADEAKVGGRVVR
jgi:hypothetical protein